MNTLSPKTTLVASLLVAALLLLVIGVFDIAMGRFDSKSVAFGVSFAFLAIMFLAIISTIRLLIDRTEMKMRSLPREQDQLAVLIGPSVIFGMAIGLGIRAALYILGLWA